MDANADRADGWIRLDDPAKVFEAMVPKKIRLDEARIGLPTAGAVNICHDGDDKRDALNTTLAAPNRWVCKLQIAYRDDVSTGISFTEGSGLLVADRYVLTAAHTLMDDVRDADGTFLRSIDAAAIVVIPGLDGRGRTAAPHASQTMPFGWVRGVAMRMNSAYRQSMQVAGNPPGALDYGLIRLAKPIGKQRFASLGNRRLSHWGAPEQRGRTRIRVLEPGRLKNVKVNAVGYPSDKCLDAPDPGPISASDLAACRPADRSSVPWYAFDRVRTAGSKISIFATLTMDHDVAPGMSGGPVWLRWKGIRNLIGINQSCTRDVRDGSILNSSAVRITRRVKADIEAWTA